MLTCGRCGQQSYCSKACQVEHWPEHKHACHTLAEQDILKKIIKQAAIKDCHRCKKTKKSTGGPLRKCATCKTRYCSLECQKLDWPAHKLVCTQSSKVHLTELQTNCRDSALDIARSTPGGDRRSEANALRHLGESYCHMGKYKKSMEYQTKALALAMEIGDRKLEAGSLTSMGSLNYSLGNHDLAIKNQQAALRIAEKIGDSMSQEQAHMNLGSIYWHIGKPMVSWKHFNYVLAIASTRDDTSGAALALTWIGSLWAGIGKYTESVECHLKGIEMLLSVDPTLPAPTCACHQSSYSTTSVLGTVYFNLGNTHQKDKKPGLAVACYLKSLPLMLKLGDRSGEGKTYYSLGVAYINLKQNGNALDNLQKALSIAKEMQDKPMIDKIQVALKVLSEKAIKNNRL